jgi:hypothetical protein
MQPSLKVCFALSEATHGGTLARQRQQLPAIDRGLVMFMP